MGRLIDADELKKSILSQNVLGETMVKVMDRYIHVVDDQPTAFDPDKVVEQLKEEKEFSYVDFGEYVDEVCPCLDAEYDDLFHRGLERAIEIVKGGGVDGN
mgnify:CR=1 FL=1